MFKNKKFKKFISIICTILTLNSTSSIFQRNLSAIQFNTSEDGESEVTLDQPFYCIVVYDQTYLTHKDNTKDWSQVPICKLIFEGLKVKQSKNLHTLAIPSSEYVEKIQGFLSVAEDENDILLVVGLTLDSDAKSMPDLPYSFIGIPQYKSNETLCKIIKSLTNINLQSLTFDKETTRRIISLELTKLGISNDCICEYSLERNGSCTQKYDSERGMWDVRPTEWHLKQPRRVLKVRDLKSWLQTNNPEIFKDQSGYSRTQKQANRPQDAEPDVLLSGETYENPTDNQITDQPNPEDTLVKSETPPLETGFQNGLNCIENINAADATEPKPSPKTPGPNNCDYKNEPAVSRTIKITLPPTKKDVMGIGIAAFVGSIISNVKKLFTRESKKSQAKNQINQKYNQHVKNKI